MMKTNYFTLFGLPEQLPVDKKALSAAYQTLQRQYHPDKMAQASESEKLQSIQQSAEINQAYKTLLDPIESAGYILTLKGIEWDNQSNGSISPDFLEQQFELRESLEMLEESQNWDQLNQFFNEVTAETKQCQTVLLKAISDENWSTAIYKINELRYLLKLEVQIEELQEQQFAL